MNFLTAKWENLIMANYEVAPELLQNYLPFGTELDDYQGKVYVSLVGFMFIKSSIFRIPIPFFGTFEEVNLRFYVKRRINGEVRRGVVFINETVPNKFVAWLANALYKEHYTAVPTKHEWHISETNKSIQYYWKQKDNWNFIKVEALNTSEPMELDSFPSFIFEHYYGYTKVSETASIEYKIDHPSWLTNQVVDFEINCDFENMYGKNFAFLKGLTPHSVLLAEGSDIAVKWKRNQL
jgi:uncharacterized protein